MRKFITAVTATAALIAAVPASGHFYAGCQKDRCKAHVIEPFQPKLRAIATCESGRRWSYNGSSGFDGGFQFSPSTWSSTGSRYAYAWQAPAREQKFRAVVWASKIGWQWRSTAGWPNCG